MKKHREGWGCIYLLINTKNSKCYVGQDQSGKPDTHRWKTHIAEALDRNSQYPLHRAIRKAYKCDGCLKNFVAEIVWVGSLEELNKKEIYYIKKYHSFISDPLGNCSYNLTVGGTTGTLGFKHSRKTKARLSESAVSQWSDFDHRQRLTDALNSFDVKKRQSDASTQYWSKPANRRKMRGIMLRKYENPVELEKHIRAMNTPATKKKCSESAISRFEDPEEHTKLSVAQRRRYAKLSEHKKLSRAMLRVSASKKLGKL